MTTFNPISATVDVPTSAFYRAKDDTIHLVANDSDLPGFHVTLKKGSESENTLRTDLINKGVIDLSRLDSTLYAQASTYSTADGPALGESLEGEAVSGLLLEDNWTVLGRTGGGLDNFLRNLIFHAAKYPERVQALGIGFQDASLLGTVGRTKASLGSVTDQADALLILESVKSIIEKRQEWGIENPHFVGEPNDKFILLFAKNIDRLVEDEALRDSIAYVKANGPKHGVFVISTLARVPADTQTVPGMVEGEFVFTVGSINRTDRKALFGKYAEVVNLENRVGEVWTLEEVYNDNGPADEDGNSVDWQHGEKAARVPVRFVNSYVTDTSWNQLS